MEGRVNWGLTVSDGKPMTIIASGEVSMALEQKMTTYMLKGR